MLLFSIVALAATDEPTIQRALAKIGVEIAASNCGTQARRTVKKVKNRFDDRILDERVTIRCKSLVLVTYRAKSHTPPHEILESLSLTGRHSKLPKEISPGATREEVLAFAERPMEKAPDALVYLLNDEGPDQQTAMFKFAKGKLITIVWSWSSQ